MRTGSLGFSTRGDIFKIFFFLKERVVWIRNGKKIQCKMACHRPFDTFAVYAYAPVQIKLSISVLQVWVFMMSATAFSVSTNYLRIDFRIFPVTRTQFIREICLDFRQFIGKTKKQKK